MATPELVTVYTVNKAFEAEIIKNALLDEGITCVIEGENQAGEAGLIGIEIKLQVPADQAEEARAFIKDHEHKDGGSDDSDESVAPDQSEEA